MRPNTLFLTLFFGLSISWSQAADPQVYRLYQGITLYAVHQDNSPFTLTLNVQDQNLFETGAREVLFKIYDPDGHLVAREIIPDDGVLSQGFLPRLGGWDHELWYYTLCYTRGSRPMFPWGGFAAPDRLAQIPIRQFTYDVEDAKPGVYRVLVSGTNDHFVSVQSSAAHTFSVGGHATWLHGNGDMLSKRYIYVPKGCTGIHFAAIEIDPPQMRRFTLSTAAGEILFDGTAHPGFVEKTIPLKDGRLDDQVLTLTVSDAPNDFLVRAHLQRKIAMPTPRHRGAASHAVMAPTIELAKAIRGGAIYHDDQVFWHGFQVRFHDFIKKMADSDFEVVNADGKPCKLVRDPDRLVPARHYDLLAVKPGFIPLNGVHEPAPLADSIMHSWPLHKNQAALNVAMKDMARGFSLVGTGDIAMASSWCNFAYHFGTYSFHWWRAAWRMMHTPEVPAEFKAILKEALLVGGDRLSFCTSVERVNGNALSHIPIALRYLSEASQDPLQKERCKVFIDRWRSEGWGEGVGISKSGDSQEHFAHDNHYGSYVLASLRAPIADLDDPVFKQVRQRLQNLYTYIYCPGANANPWSSRTHITFPEPDWTDGKLKWRGEPGPAFTVNVNDGGEWFAARRKNYYAVTFHGRLAPTWLVNGFYGQIGFSGGILCQLTVPGRGTVLHPQLNGSYGKGMKLNDWRKLHLHGIVGTLADGRPFVAAVSEHDDAKLDGNTVSSSGEVRDRPLTIARSYTYEDDRIRCQASLGESAYAPLLTLWSPDRRGKWSMLSEAYEMIPYPLPARGGKDKPKVTLHNGDKSLGELTTTAQGDVKSVVIDRGGYGVRVELPQPMTVLKGEGDTVLIRLIDEPAPANKASIQYDLVPFNTP